MTRTRLFLCAALAALLTGCEATQIVDVDGRAGTGPGGTKPGTGTPSATGIDYTPRGGSGRVGATASLAAICTLSSCNKPFWHSNHPELISVTGNEVVNGFHVGMSATLRFVAPSGSTQVKICVQPSVSVTSPQACYDWSSNP
jgi:hypothetical protein